MHQSEIAIVYFDGVCNLCNASVDFIIKRDKRRVFRFASLQSVSGLTLLKENGFSTSDYDSFILVWQGVVFQKSSAALKVAQLLGFPYVFSGVFWIIPVFIRDYVYSIIARNRYRWFGKKETCRLPTVEERALFL